MNENTVIHIFKFENPGFFINDTTCLYCRFSQAYRILFGIEMRLGMVRQA